MPILNQQNPQEIQRYQEFIRNARYTAITQDYHWRKVKENWESLYVYLEKDQQIVAAMSILMIQNIGEKRFAYVTKGPVMNEIDVNLMEELVEEAEGYLKEKQVFLLRMDPEFVYNTDLNQELSQAGFVLRNRNVSGKDTIQPRFNMLVDLHSHDPEKVLAERYGKTRYRIRYAQKKGLQARRSDQLADLPIFYHLYEETSLRHGISYRPYAYFERLAENYLKRGLMKIIIVEIDGVADAAGLCFSYGNSVWYMYAGSTHENQCLMAPYLMNWEGICWAIEEGKEYYDLGGVFDLDNSDGLYMFKYGFTRPNPAVEYIGEIDKVFDESAYQQFETQ